MLLYLRFFWDTEVSHEHKKTEKITVWYNFVVQQENLFIRKIYSREDILSMQSLSTLKKYYEKFCCFSKTVIFLERYNKSTNLTSNNDQETWKEFFTYDLNDEFEDTDEIYDAIDDFIVVKNCGQYNNIDKIIGSVSSNIMKFKKAENVKSPIFSAIFIDNVKGLIDSKNMIHSHVSGKIISYAHSYCNLKVK